MNGYWVKDGYVYVAENGKYRNVAITGKFKEIKTTQLESIEVTPGSVVVDTLEGAALCTETELVARFHLDENNPVKAIAKAAKKK